jgi:hypothetical protein
VIVGLELSVTTTLKVHDAKLSLLSVALQVTTVVPKGNMDPLVALQPLDLMPDASVGDTLYVTIVRALPPDVTLVGLVVGHPGLGGVTSVVSIVNAQLDVRFALSVFVHPTYTSWFAGIKVPFVTLHVGPDLIPDPSDDTMWLKFTMVPDEFVSGGLRLEQVSVGGVVSETLTENVHGLDTRPLLSVAVQETVVTEGSRKVEPELGVHWEEAIPNASVALGLNKTAIDGTPEVGEVDMLAGHVMTGLVLSVTTILKVQLFVLPLWSVALQKTVVVPTLNVAPLVALQPEEATAKLSEAVNVKLTDTVVDDELGLEAMFEGQDIEGGIVSGRVTITLKAQLDVSPTASVAVHVTVVAPRLKEDPEACEQATAGVKPELSVAEGLMNMAVDDVPDVMTLTTSLGHTPITGAAT